MKRSSHDGQFFFANGKLWRTFAPGWRFWRWFGWIGRRIAGVPTRTHRLQFPDGEVRVRAEQTIEPVQRVRLARQAPLGASKRGTK